MASAADPRGQTITTALRPDRIVSLVPSVTESVAQLAGVKRLVGITKFCTEPEAEAPAIRKIGGTKDPDIAAIVALAREHARLPPKRSRVTRGIPVPCVSEPWYCCAEPMESL